MEVFLNEIDAASRKRLQAALEIGEIGFWDIDVRNQVLTCSTRCKKNYGRNENEDFSLEDLIGSIYEEDLHLWAEKIDQAIAAGGDFEVEYRIKWHDGLLNWILVHGNCATDNDGRPLALSGTATNVTERKKMEENLRQSQMVLTKAQRIARLGNWEWNLQTNHAVFSEETRRIFGISHNEIDFTLNTDLWRIHKDDQEYVRAALQRAVEQTEPYDVEYRITLPDHSERMVHAVAELTFDKDNKPLNMSGTIQDITDFKTVESERFLLSAQVKTQQEYLNNIIANLPGVIWETQVDKTANTQQVDFVSDYIEKMVGYSPAEWLAKPNFWLEMVHPDDKEQALSEAQAFLQNGGRGIQQYRWIAKNGDIVWVETHMVGTFNEQNALRNIQGITMDISERRNAEESLRKREEELLQAQKLESVGRLAGGIAHDFNNMLTAINGYSDLILKNLNESDPIYRKVSEIRKAGERSAVLTQQLLAFSRQQIMQTKEVSLNQIVTDTNDMLDRLLGEDIKIVTEFKDERSPISMIPDK